jgi:hypothetical protein
VRNHVLILEDYMNQRIPKRSVDEEKILLALSRCDTRGLSRQQVSQALQETNIVKVFTLLRQLEQLKLVSESLVMALDDTDPDDISSWHISSDEIDYLKIQALL